MKAKKVLAIAGVVLLLLAPTLVAETAEVKCPNKIKVEAAKVAGQKFMEYKVFQSKVNPEMIAVKSLVDGKVTDVKVAEGDLVSKGLEIFVLNEGLAAEIKSLEVDLKKWKRTLFLRKNWKVKSPKAEKQAESKIEKIKADIEARKAAVSDYTITAPADGKIKALKMEKGNDVQAGSVVAVIENKAKVVALLEVSAEDQALFSQGQVIPVLISKLEGEYEAQVEKVAGNKVVLAIPNKAREIKEDYAIKFKLLKKEHADAVVLPVQIIQKDDTGAFVYTVDGKFALKTALKVAAVTGKEAMIAEGVVAGDQVIITEIVSAKEGTVRDEFKCLKDKAKIAVMFKDAESGRFLKKKPVKKAKAAPVKKVKVEKKKVVKKKVEKKPVVKKDKPAGQNHLVAGLGAGIFYVNQKNWADVYSKGNMVMGIKFAYQLQNKYEIFAEIDMMKATGELNPTLDETTVSSMPIYFGGKYLFNAGPKFQPYVGLAVVMASLKEENDFGEINENAIGASLMFGSYYHFSSNLSLDLVLKYDSLKFDIADFNEEADMSGARLMLFLSYKF